MKFFISALIYGYFVRSSTGMSNIRMIIGVCPQLVDLLDNIAVSFVGAKMAFKSNKEIALQVRSIPLDEMIKGSEPVLLLKIDVQGWEYHVLKGAKKLLSRKKGDESIGRGRSTRESAR